MRCDSRVTLTGLCLIASLCSCFAAAVSAQSARPLDTLETIQKFSGCLSALARTAAEPQMQQNINQLATGLTSSWGRVPPEQALARMPPAYRDHLLAATDACERARRQALTAEKPIDRDALVAFARDVEVKLSDCRNFKMGRMVPVQITVMKDGVPESGWSIFYKWLPGSAATNVLELSFPAPTPGAVRDLPAGMYMVRGERSSNGSTIRTAALPLPVGGKTKVVFSISAP